MAERKYRMTRLGAGDYLLPGNDGATIWRLVRYEEDGSATWGDSDEEIVGMFWEVRRFAGTLAELQADPLLLDDWRRWSHYESLLPSRKAAIEAALTADI